MHLFTLATVLLMSTISHGENIVFFFGIASYSHRIIAWPLAEALAAKGHTVTFVSPFKAKVPNPNITDYVPKSLLKWSESWDDTNNFFEQRLNENYELEWYKLPDFGIAMCQVLMEDSEYVNWIKKTKFDLVIIDSLANECGYGMADYHKAKTIIFNTANPFPWYSEPFGFPDESSSIPDMIFHPYPRELTFYQRAIGLFNPLYFSYIRQYSFFPALENIIRLNLDPKFSSLMELERNTSLIFINYYFAEDFARPLPPNVIPIGGMHCGDEMQKIPQDMADFLNGGNSKDEGFIYISFGSYADISNFPNATQDEILNTLRNLKNIKIIWKLNSERPANLPDNVFTSKWVPQQAVLAHPKIRAFVTHGGLLGIQEALCNPVPMIVFPLFAEQDYNANKIDFRKIGIKLEITTVTEQKFIGAIQTVLKDDTYSNNMKKISKIFRDRPVKPVEVALWWTEYVLRHEDVSSLRPLSVYQSWWKRRQLDIWFSVFAITLGLLYFISKILKWGVKSFVNDNVRKVKMS